MTDYNNYKLEIKLHGPVFIGSGDQMNKKEYALDRSNRKIYMINNHKLFNFLYANNKIDSFNNFMLNYRENDLMKWLNNMHLSNHINEFIEYDISTEDIMLDRNFRNIDLFVKDAYNKPYIPGSSIKGAIRTALLSSYIREKNIRDDNKSKLANQGNFIYREIGRARNRNHLDNLFKNEFSDEEKELFNNDNPQEVINDLMQYILVSDSQPLNYDRLMLCQKVELHSDGKTTSLPIYRECLRPGTIFSVDISIPELIPFTKEKFPITIEDILGGLDKRYEYYEFDIEGNAFNLDIVESDGARFYLGGGVGFTSKTLIYDKYGYKEGLNITSGILDKQFYKHKHKGDIRQGVSPRVKKVTYYKNKIIPMGICSALYIKR